MIGYLFGASYDIAAKYLGRFVIVSILIIILLIWGYKFINKREHIFSRKHLYALVINIFSVYVFAKLMEDVMDHEFVVNIDKWVSANIVSLWNPLLNNFFIAVTNIGSPLVLVILSVIMLFVLIYLRKWYFSWLLFFSMIGGLLVRYAILFIVQRARPENSLVHLSSYSFPSGHAMMSLIFFTLVIIAFEDDIKNVTLKWLFISVNVLLFSLVGFSRVYLNVHWLSDVVAGFALGIFWLTFLILVFKVMSLLKRNKKEAKSHVKK
jgi:undecaprenyl-diphosphatase